MHSSMLFTILAVKSDDLNYKIIKLTLDDLVNLKPGV